MDKLLKYNGVQEALKFLREDDERTLQEHLEMCQIPAPSYEGGAVRRPAGAGGGGPGAADDESNPEKEDGGCRAFRCAH